MTKYVSCIYGSLLGWGVEYFTNRIDTYFGRIYKCVLICVPRNKDNWNIEYKRKEADSRNYTSVEKGFDKCIMPHAIIMQLINKTDTQDLICFSNNMEMIFLRERKQKGELVHETHLFNACTNHI